MLWFRKWKYPRKLFKQTLYFINNIPASKEDFTVSMDIIIEFADGDIFVKFVKGSKYIDYRKNKSLTDILPSFEKYKKVIKL